MAESQKIESKEIIQENLFENTTKSAKQLSDALALLEIGFEDVIKAQAKILKNNTNVTPDQLLYFLKFVFGIEINSVVAEGNAEFTILLGKDLTAFERVLLTYVSYSNGYPSRFVPKPIGVQVNFGSFNADNFFGYQGAPNAKGYGDLNDLSTGGVYAQLLT